MDRFTDKVSAVIAGSKPIDGTVIELPAPSGKSRQLPNRGNLTILQVHPDVMRAARRALRPGERLEIVNAETVRLVPDERGTS